MYLCDKGSILVLPIEYVKKIIKERMFIMNSKKNNKRKDVYYEFEKQKNL